ncbi:unnamed protein product [Pleuronectes platessa]|uniref:Uncharacterized protein n=1 Tax=Pleuronectes platessa TaxID=8262 RepID=A0A9N7U490_PLEPL|nr:unnamed protein product [Pleuronectes platessa]
MEYSGGGGGQGMENENKEHLSDHPFFPSSLGSSSQLKGFYSETYHAPLPWLSQTHRHEGTPKRIRTQRHTDIVFTAFHSSLTNSNGLGETVHSSERENKREREPEIKIERHRKKNYKATMIEKEDDTVEQRKKDDA